MREIEEVWKPIEGYDYMVSNLGRVKSLDRVDSLGHHRKEKILQPVKSNNGYLRVMLYNDGKVKRYLVHRLVGNAFIPNPNDLPEVNHKDEDKTNNKVENLEWCDSTYNKRYSKAISVNQFTLDGKFIRMWDCIREIGYQTGFDNSNIIKCCQGKLKTAYGFIWRYA